MEIDCVYRFAHAQSGGYIEKETWLCALALVISPKSSPAFLSWCAYHINDIDLMIKTVESTGALWPGIQSARLLLLSSQHIILRATR